MEKYTQYKEAIMNTIKHMENNDIMYIYNEYCLYARYYDDIIMTKDELYEYLETFTQEQAFKLGYKNTRFSLYDDYFTHNSGYEELTSFSTPIDKIKDYLEEIACHILDNEESFGYDELEELIEEYWYNDLPDID